MAEPFIGEIRLFTMPWVPRGWAQCNGQLLSVMQNQALFTILGNVYGGDGKTTFAVPNLCGTVPVHCGSTFKLGATGGEEAHTLTINEIPQHTHQVMASDQAANQTTAAGNVWPQSGTTNFYANNANTTLRPDAIANAGASQPHPNMQPYLVLNFCIAVIGLYPPRN